MWRSGQQRQCFVYRFFATGTIEEMIYERQLSKEGLAGQVAPAFSGRSGGWWQGGGARFGGQWRVAWAGAR